MSPKWMDFFQVSFLKLPNPFSQSETIIMFLATVSHVIIHPQCHDPILWGSGNVWPRHQVYIYKYHSGWWLNQPIWTILVKMDHFPKRDENKKSLKPPHSTALNVVLPIFAYHFICSRPYNLKHASFSQSPVIVLNRGSLADSQITACSTQKM